MNTMIEKNKIKVLLMDIGGVFLTNGWPKESREAAARKFGFDFSEMDRRHDLAFDVYEEGGMALDDYLDIILFYQERPFTKEAFREFIFQQSQPLTEMLEGMIAWKESHPHLRFFSLNNEPKELHDYRVQQFNLRRVYDGFIASGDVGLRKPNPAIYKLAVAVAGVQPNECLYIDDREVLVAAGQKTGLHAWTHRSAAETFRF